MDRASWHSNKTENKLENLSIMHLPTSSPELNPLERGFAILGEHNFQAIQRLRDRFNSVLTARHAGYCCSPISRLSVEQVLFSLFTSYSPYSNSCVTFKLKAIVLS